MSKLKEINGKYYQECEVVMLVTDKELEFNSIALLPNNQLNLMSNNDMIDYLDSGSKATKRQEFYFLSNEKPKEGDWCYHPEMSQEYTIINNGDIHNIKKGLHPAQGVFEWKSTTNEWYKKAKKIIATTDKLALEPYQGHFEGIDCTNYLPQPSQSFIKAYIETYNKSEHIKKVLVEYENSQEGKRLKSFGFNLNPVLKVNSSNEITIKKIKDSWTREELPIDSMITLRNSFNSPIFRRKFKNTVLIEAIQELDKWIEENL